MERKLIHPFIAFAALAIAVPASADLGPGSFTYEGRVYESDGNPSTRTVNMRLQVLNPTGDCVLRDEVVSGVDLSATDGTFAVSVGTGTTHANDPGNTISNIYRNSGGNIPGRDSSNNVCAYAPASGHVRKLRIWVDGVAMTPDISINSVPYAESADHLRGKAPSDFVSINPATQLTQANLENVFGDAAKLANLIQIAQGNFTAKSTSSGVALPSYPGNPSTPVAGSIWFDSTANQLKYKDGSGVQTLSAGGSGITSINGDIAATGSGSVSATIAIGAVTSAKISDGTISTADVADSAITSLKIAEGTVATADIANSAVTFAKIQNISSLKVLGRSTVSVGPVEEISIGTGLSLTGGVLSSTAGLPVCADGHLALFVSTSWVCVGASSANTASTFVRRDSSGNFVAGTATLTNSLVLKDGAAGPGITIGTPVGFTSYSLTLPADDGNAGQVLATNGTGVLSWVTPGGGGDFKADGSVMMTGQVQGSPSGNQNMPQYSFSSDGDSGLYRTTNDTIGLATNGIARLHVTPTGQVGIGTVSPQSVFHVHASNFAETTYSNPAGGSFSVGLVEGTNSLGAYTGGFSHPANTAYFLNFSNTPIVFGINNSTPVMVMKPDGNVDIKGGVKVGNSVATCIAGAAGMLRFAAGKIDFCNGSLWQTLSSGAAPSMSSGAAGPFDFSATGVHQTVMSCTVFTLHNLKDGGVYKFLVSGSSTGTCSFNAFQGAGTGPLTVHFPQGHSGVSASKSLYTLTVVGTEVFAERTLF